MSMTSSQGKTRRPPTYLSDEDKYKIYTYCIENKDVIQEGLSTRYRVLPRIIAQEINEKGLLKEIVSEHHIRKSIEIVIEWQFLLNRLPEPQQTVHEDQLQAEITRLNIKVKNLELKNAELEKKISVPDHRDEILKQVEAKSMELSRLLHAPFKAKTTS